MILQNMIFLIQWRKLLTKKCVDIESNLFQHPTETIKNTITQYEKTKKY